MNAHKAAKEVCDPLKKELNVLAKNLGKDLWAHQPSAVIFLYATLMDQNKVQLLWSALSMFCWAGLMYFLQTPDPKMVSVFLVFLFLIQVRGGIEALWVFLKWRKLPETGKMPTKIAKGDLE